MKLHNRLKRIKENGKTYLYDEDTGEKVQVWSDEVRANQAARIQRWREKEQSKSDKKRARIKQSSRVTPQQFDQWRRCDAMKCTDRPCNKWQKLRRWETNDPKVPYKCRECSAHNKPVNRDFFK